MREQKLAEVKSSLKACKVSCSRDSELVDFGFDRYCFNIITIHHSFQGSLDAEWLEINSVFSEVMRVVEDTRQKALQPLEERSVLCSAVMVITSSLGAAQLERFNACPACSYGTIHFIKTNVLFVIFRRRRVKKEAQSLVQNLEREIDQLKQTIDELDKNPDLQVTLCFNCTFQTTADKHTKTN